MISVLQTCRSKVVSRFARSGPAVNGSPTNRDRTQHADQRFWPIGSARATKGGGS